MAERFYVQDVDECLFNSVPRHHRDLNYFGPILYGWKEPLPTYEEICQKGGSHKAYGHLEGYQGLNAKMIESANFNTGLEEISHARDSLILLAPNLLAYLTTRPDALFKLTRNELVKSGFPDRPVIARPDHIPLEQTSQWKLSVLTLIAEAYQDKIITMIDDSVNMHRTIVETNNPRIESILFKGPMTPPHEMAQDWNQIVQNVALSAHRE